MIDFNDPELILARVLQTVEAWPEDRRRSHGFDLLLGPEEKLRRNRRLHARCVLVSESVLIDIADRLTDQPILMKGLEVAHLYPSLCQRPFRDLDLLVTNAPAIWTTLQSEGYRSNPNRRPDIDHHHMPALVTPHGIVGVELHMRPNIPRWATLPTDLIYSTSQESRTGIPGVRRPRDDIHALLMAMHCWKGGFTRQRDLLDAMLLAAVSTDSVARTAESLGLSSFWRWTMRFADSVLLGGASKPTAVATHLILPHRPGIADRTRTRLLAPFLVASPWRVAKAHAAEYRLGLSARASAGNTGDDR